MKCLVLAFGLTALALQVDAAPYVNVRALMPMVCIAHEVEKKHGIPENLLMAIGHVESGNKHFAVNARGRGHFFKTKEAAVAFVEKMLAQGVKDFNIGCMQINYLSHRKRFKSLSHMLELRNNMDYAAKLLKIYYKRTGSWESAVRLYKSGASESTRKYKNLVFSIWAKVHVPKDLLKREIEKHESSLKKVSLKKTLPTYQMSFAKTPPKVFLNDFLKVAQSKSSKKQVASPPAFCLIESSKS